MPGLAGSVGYPDYQRLSNYDSPTLYTIPAGHGASAESAVKDVSKFANVSMWINPKVANTKFLEVQLRWFANEAATIPLGIRTFTLGPEGESPVERKFVGRVPNLGPYLRVTVRDPGGGAAWEWEGVFFADNRSAALASPVVEPGLLRQTAVVIGGGEKKNYYPNYYFAGPVNVSMWTSKEPLSFQLQTVPSASTAWQFVSVAEADAIEKWHSAIFNMPVGAWRLTVENGAAEAATIYVVLTPATTGST